MANEIPDLGYALKLRPDAAVRYFESKGYRLSWNWQDTWQEANAKAFTVAKVARLDVLNDIRESVATALKEGRTERWFQQQLTPVLQAKGWWGRRIVVDSSGAAERVQLGSPQRLRTIYRTNLQTAYMAGRFEQFARNSAERPYIQYVAVMDARTRPSHAAMHGKVYRFDDPIWTTWWPPNGFNCRCRVRARSERDVDRYKLRVHSSEGQLRTKTVDAGVDLRTGEILQTEVSGVRVTGADGKSRVVWTDPGWAYNPGRAAHVPDLDGYPTDTARQWVEGHVTGPDFARGFSIWQRAVQQAMRDQPDLTPRQVGAQLARSNRLGGMEQPVAVLREADRQALGTQSQTVRLSTGTLIEHLAAHPDITLAQYRLLPRLIDTGEVYAQGDRRIALLASDGGWLRAGIKVDREGRRVYLLTLHRIGERQVAAIRSRWERVR
jgi:SPP1 gp7 family putative phage head morphogenesis protein